jgi:hypothetical protein
MEIAAIDHDRLDKDLEYRERVRREAMGVMHSILRQYASWNESLVECGLPKRPFPVADLQAQLLVIEAICAADKRSPIGPAAHQAIDALITVPINISGRFAIVRDSDIPEPWLTRYGHFAGPRAMTPEGFYAWDWQEFLRKWKWETEDFLVILSLRIQVELDAGQVGL